MGSGAALAFAGFVRVILWRVRRLVIRGYFAAVPWACAPLLLIGCVPVIEHDPAVAVDTVYRGGYVWNGDTFERRDLFVAGGRFVAPAAVGAEEVIDVEGAYVLPPLCDAHSHAIQSSWRLEETLAALRGAGIGYVKVMSSVPEYTAEIAERLTRSDGVDAAFAGPPITGPNGHPSALQTRFHGYGAYPGKTLEELDGFSYIAVASHDELDLAWARLLPRGINFVKVMLLHASLHHERVNQPAYRGRTGLDPALLPALVEKAHTAGLRVSAHVDTADDFRRAVAAGVDEIAHLPGRQHPDPLTAADAETAARAGVVVVTTAALANRLAADDPARYRALRAAQTESLTQLKAAGVTVTVGTDDHVDLHGELAYLASLAVYSNAELLAMVTRGCAQTTFPGRRIGVLAPGYEASLLLLEQDPSVALSRLKAPLRLIKAPP